MKHSTIYKNIYNNETLNYVQEYIQQRNTQQCKILYTTMKHLTMYKKSILWYLQTKTKTMHMTTYKKETQLRIEYKQN